MKKKILALSAAFLLTAALSGCACQHDWAQATCDSPKTCTKCDLTEGEALGHIWQEADCETPKTCSRCGATEGQALGHQWTEADCTAAKTCSICSATEGEPLGHTWEGEATLYTGPVCSICGTEGDPLPGYFTQNGLSVNAFPRQSTDYITNTYVRPDLNTIGEFQASSVLVFEWDETHRAKNGYEWRTVDITIHFSDNNSALYGTNVICARADYYQDQELKQAKKQDRFTVHYNGKDYPCMAYYENAGFSYTATGTVFQMSCYVQVPVGYDGVVLAFTRGSIDVNGMHLHEVEDEHMLLLRIA